MTEDEINGMQAMVGCVTGLHDFCRAVASSLPPDLAAKVDSNLRQSSTMAELNNVLNPGHPSHVAEYSRTIEGLRKALHSRTQS